MSNEPALSLVLATYGRADVLAQLVASLMAQTSRDFEVIVADQNRDDRVGKWIAPLAGAGLIGAHLKLSTANLSAARNAGIAAARGAIVAFPDDDCWYEPDALARATDHFAADPSLDGLAAAWSEAGHERGDEHALISSERMRRFRAGNLASITLFLRTEAVRAAGGFDVEIGVGRWYGAGEETDLVLSLLARGCRMKRAPDVIVHHLRGPAATPALAAAWRQERARSRGTGALYAKHRLPPWVIARGLVAPLAARPGPALAVGTAQIIGRLEGLVGWHLGAPRRRTSSEVKVSDRKGQHP